jgi:hypothetical protein
MKQVLQLSIDFKKAYDAGKREVLYNILVEFVIPIKLLRLTRMCLNEIYNRVRVRKHLYDMLPIKNGFKQGDALSSLFFNFALEYAIKRLKVNQDGLKLNGALQHLFHTDVNILGGSVHTIKKNTETLVVASKKIGIEVNADKTKNMVILREQNAR